MKTNITILFSEDNPLTPAHAKWFNVLRWRTHLIRIPRKTLGKITALESRET